MKHALVTCTLIYVVMLSGSALAAPAQAEHGPVSVAVGLMASFDGVTAESVTAEVLSEGANLVVVGAYAPNGRLCRIEVERAPVEASAPYGWAVGAVACAHRNAGMPVMDMEELNRLNKGQ